MSATPRDDLEVYEQALRRRSESADRVYIWTSAAFLIIVGVSLYGASILLNALWIRWVVAQ